MDIAIRLKKGEESVVYVPVTDVTGAVFMCGAARPSSDAVHILVAFRGVLCKVDPCPKHPPYVGVPLIKPFMDDGVDEW